MRDFSIKELETLCGIQAHTLRIWEQRYSLVKPVRKGNLRRYSIDELEKLLLVAQLKRSGRKISALSRLHVAELLQQVELLKTDEERKDRTICQLILCMYRMNIVACEAVLNDSFLSWPADVVVTEIIYPFLCKVNLLFQGRRLNEEHLVVNAIRKKLLWCIEKINDSKKREETAVLFLCGERQLDLLLLYAYFRLKREGWDVLYLGSDVSVRNLEDLFSVKKPHRLFTYLPRRSTLFLNELGSVIKKHASEAQLVFADVHKEKLQAHNGGSVFVMEVDEALTFLLE